MAAKFLGVNAEVVLCSLRLVRADIEGEIDMDLDPGPTTFCCIPRFVPHWYREIFVFRLDYFRGINSEIPEFIGNTDSEMPFPNRYFACFGIREFR